MENQELFDKYIKRVLTEEQLNEFNARLKSDKEFFNDFQLFLLVVHGFQREEEQDCLEFANAMKRLSKEELQGIIGKKQEKPARMINIQRYFWPLSSAAILIIAFIFTYNIEKQSRYSIDDMIYTYNEPVYANRGGEDIDFSNINNENLEELLPKLQMVYNEASNAQDEFIYGKSLAVVYIKLHNRNAARTILQELINKYKNNSEYSYAVAECRNILEQIK